MGAPDLERAPPCLVMDAESIASMVSSLATQITRQFAGAAGLDKERLAIVGIHTRGVEVARRLAAQIAQGCGVAPGVGALDISMYRDDLQRQGGVRTIQPTDLPFDLDDCDIILADDVFFTGRTARAALDALNAFGRPRRVRLAVLVDRGHRQLPICADYKGADLPTQPDDRVRVSLHPYDDGPEGVWLVKKAAP